MHVTTTDDVRVHVVVAGPAGGAPVVLLHGVVLSHRSWDPVVADLHERGYRTVRPDLRGHGLSDRDAPYDLGGYLADAVAVCEQAAGSPAFVVGHSLGGVTAAALAQQRPALVTGLLLEDPALLLAAPADQPPEGPLIDTFRLVQRAAPRLQADGVTEEQLTAVLDDVPTPFGVPARERYHDGATRTWAHGQLHLDPAVLDPIIDPPAGGAPEVFDIDRGVAVPGLVVAADVAAPDRVTSRTDEARLVAASPRLRWRRLEGAGHNLHDERGQRERFLEALHAELATHHPAA